MNYVKKFMKKNKLQPEKLFSIKNPYNSFSGGVVYNSNDKVFYIDKGFRLKSSITAGQTSHSSILTKLLTGEYSVEKDS